MHGSGRHNVADPLSRNPNFKHLNALLAVTTRSSTGNSVRGSTGKQSVQDLHSDPASDTTASHAGQKRRKGASTPTTGANTTPLNTADDQHPADSTRPMSVHEQSATVQQPSSSGTAGDLHDISWYDVFAEAYAADPDFTDEEKTADLTFAAGLWWKADRIVVPKSADTKRLILQAFHDHPMAGHYDVTKTLKAVKGRFYWPHADAEVRNYIRNCPSCQVQTTHSAKPAGLLQPLDVPPYAWHTVTTDYITGLPLTPKGHMLLLSLWIS